MICSINGVISVVTTVITFDDTIVYSKNNNQKAINQIQCHKTAMASNKLFTTTNEPKTSPPPHTCSSIAPPLSLLLELQQVHE